MKIGIITFHWGTNYGGVLQAYSLQQFLSKNIEGSEVYMINYAPKTHSESLMKCVLTKSVKQIPSNITTFFKEKKFVPFRQKYLNTTRRYYSLDDLKTDYPDFDVYICGSDQVWNPYIVSTYGIPYYLPFGKDQTKRISFAVSFGCTEYPDDKMAIIKPLIERFDALSVREKTGVSILNKGGIENVKMMPDPTLLLERSDLDAISNVNSSLEGSFAFFYSLQDNQVLVRKISDYFGKREGISVVNTKKSKYSTLSIETWLSNIKNSKYVITNSFHGAVFSILFNKQFIVVPIEGRLSGMNDRIYTLLDKFELRERLVETFDENKLTDLLDQPINWGFVENVQTQLKKTAELYLSENITF
jgi:hypothetical protein